MMVMMVVVMGTQEDAGRNDPEIAVVMVVMMMMVMIENLRQLFRLLRFVALLRRGRGETVVFRLQRV